MSEIDNLLDQTLDDIADLPEFKPYPAGAHRVLVSFSTKEVNKHPCIEADCKLVETLELANPTSDTAPTPGATASSLFMLDNEIGAGMFKEIATPLGALFGTGSLRDIVEQTSDIECIITTSQDKEGKYMNIKTLDVV